MSEYIYRPPPPPPPSSSTAGPYRGGYNAQRGRSGDERGGGRGGRGGRGGGGGGGRGRGNSNVQPVGQRPQQFNLQRQQHPLPRFPPQTHINPTFLSQQQQLFSNTPAYSAPLYTPIQEQWQPPLPQVSAPADSPYLSYSQEQLQSQQAKQQSSQTPQKTESYVTAPSGWPAQSSYGHFELPQQPKQTPLRKQRRNDRPDMDEETWLSLNGGKLLGTNIAPPETPEEIEAWIAQRKARFPTAKKVAEAQEKKESADNARESKLASQQEPHPQKRKRPISEGDASIHSDIEHSASESESEVEAPEALSSKTKQILPSAPPTGYHHESKKKLAPVCRNYAARGKCPRGDTCNFRHEDKRGQVKKKERKMDDGGRKTLYQRLVEQDQEKENALMLQVIQYLIDKGRLQEESAKGERS